MRSVYSFIKDRTATASIEFALTIIFFVFTVFFIAEVGRLAYVSSVIDLAVSEAAKDAKNVPSSTSGDYRTRFEDRMLRQTGALWRFLTNSDAVEISMGYASSIDEMNNSGGSSGNYRNQPIARYQVKYRYEPMFFLFPGFWADSLLNREVIFVQEYERSKFMH
jgi:tight adherence protein E